LYDRNILFAKDLLNANIQRKLFRDPLSNGNVTKLIKEAEILFN